MYKEINLIDTTHSSWTSAVPCVHSCSVLWWSACVSSNPSCSLRLLSLVEVDTSVVKMISLVSVDRTVVAKRTTMSANNNRCRCTSLAIVDGAMAVPKMDRRRRTTKKSVHRSLAVHSMNVLRTTRCCLGFEDRLHPRRSTHSLHRQTTHFVAPMVVDDSGDRSSPIDWTHAISTEPRSRIDYCYWTSPAEFRLARDRRRRVDRVNR